MTDKNQILSKLIEGLVNQRNKLNLELADINHNEGSFIEKRTTLENAVNKIDMEVNSYILHVEYGQQ